MRRRSNKTTIEFVLIVVLALVLTILAILFLPIPGEFKKLVFFLMIPAITAIGVFITSRQKRR